MPVALLGGGTKRVLSIAMAMLYAKGGCVLIDEIETGLHYSAQEALWRAIITWADQLDVQVFVTTHSYECIKAFRAAASGSLFADQSKLFRIERQRDDFKAIAYDQDELERSIERIWEVR
jgi:AAA15 family ATPase/GTPase